MDDTVKTNHNFFPVGVSFITLAAKACLASWWEINLKEFPQTMELSTIQFGSFKPAFLHEHGLPNLVTQEEFFLGRFFDKIIVNTASFSEVEEEMDKKDDGDVSFE